MKIDAAYDRARARLVKEGGENWMFHLAQVDVIRICIEECRKRDAEKRRKCAKS